MLPNNKMRNIIDSNVDNDHDDKTTGQPTCAWFGSQNGALHTYIFQLLLLKLRKSAQHFFSECTQFSAIAS